ncbi:GNAT family N-acetyltransferase [Aliifodinibius salicampi]|uniref:GNAT family N-acetyltransferase n=1 Tax=Fodinibius salicampi TaxID=1920655 RepID=A0ABT3PY56_9BACT|nr:GNAT family N-acetyltransferase [Fodinibius salicampi]MCW9712781.1 GNAT family N-acetyltransferase [Fodinibius salicampi]
MDIQISVADSQHFEYAKQICDLMEEAAKQRGTGIAKRKPEYIRSKMEEGKAVVAIDKDEEKLAGFCYIESWGHDKYIANSGLIVHPHYRKLGLGRRIKERVFKLSREKYPDAKIFGITTSMAVMKINSDMGYKPVTFDELTQDEEFWKGCQSCPNYDILTNEDRKGCLCTGMLYDPEKEEKKQEPKQDSKSEQKEKRWEQFKRFLRLHKRNLERKTKHIFKFKLNTNW